MDFKSFLPTDKVNEYFEEYSSLQRMFLVKNFLGGFTTTLMVAILTTEIIDNFSSDIVLLKNYLYNTPMLLIMIPFIKNMVKRNPINCYLLKGIISVGGLFLLVVTEALSLSKVWYLVDAAMVAFIGLLMMLHSNYYKSAVINKCQSFSEDLGYVDLINNITFAVFGLAIVYFEIPTLVLLLLTLPLEILERYFENKCVKIVYAK